jgi:hypothetical protein
MLLSGKDLKYLGISTMRRLAWVAALAFSLTTAVAQSPVSISLNLAKPGSAIPEHFIGLSYETRHVLADGKGRHYFSASNRSLVRTFQLLGVKNLRVGGNTSDTGPIPSTKDVDDLFAFARAAGVDVIYTLKLKNSNAAANAPIADHIVKNFRTSLACFALGNEPSFFAHSFNAYETQEKSYMAAIDPRASYCGSDAADGGTWASSYASAFAGARNVALVTQHNYLGNGRVNSGAIGRDVMLSPNTPASYAKLHDGFASSVAQGGFPFRLSETNSFFHGGAADASNTFASALWGLDYLHWWAAHGAAGLNFHTGDTVSSAAGGPDRSPDYAVFITSNDGQHVHPLGYAVKAFDLGSHGAIIPVTLTNPDDVNLTAYGVLSGADGVYVTIINKEHDAGARSASVTITADPAYTKGQVLFLAAPHGDVSTTDGVTLGGAAITDGGAWNGSFSALPTASSGQFAVKLPAATAAVLHLTRTVEGHRPGSKSPDVPSAAILPVH